MQHIIFRCGQIKNGKTVTVDLVLIGITVVIYANAPFFCHIRIFGTVESNSVIIIWLSVAKFRLLNDVIGTMVDYFFHNVTFIFVQIILLEEYKKSSANIVPLQEYNFNRGCEKSELFTCIDGKGNRVFKQRKFCYNVNTQRRALYQM